MATMFAGRGAPVGGVDHVERQEQDPGDDAGDRTRWFGTGGKLARRTIRQYGRDRSV